MSTTIIQVDSFSNRPFGGNPAAVCVLEGPAPEGWMQRVASEMNLSETAFLHPIEGGRQVARAWVEIAGRRPENMTFLERTVNGRPGLVARQGGVVVTVFAFDVVGDRIARIWVIRNPEKLRPWTGSR